MNFAFWQAFLAGALLHVSALHAQTHPDLSSLDRSSDSLLVRSIFDEVLANGEAHQNLRILCKDIGNTCFNKKRNENCAGNKFVVRRFHQF